MDLRKLSTQLGLSMTTVSRALNGYADVSESTRARVIDAAREAGYQPNPVARRLALGRAEAIGLVLPNAFGDLMDPFFAELLRGMASVVDKANLDLLVAAAPAGPSELRAYRRLVEGQRVDGLIVGRTRAHDERIEYLLDQDFPFVCHGRTLTDRDYAYLDIDGEAGFRLLTQRMLDFGHRRVGLINPPSSLMFGAMRRRGYEETLREAGLCVDLSLIAEGEMTEETGYDAAQNLLSLADPATALLCGNDSIAVGAMHAVKAAGLQVCQDVSVAGYDDLPISRYTEPALTTLRQPIRDAGARIVEMLLARLSGTPAAELQELWAPTLIERRSDGPAPIRKSLETRDRHATVNQELI